MLWGCSSGGGCYGRCSGGGGCYGGCSGGPVGEDVMGVLRWGRMLWGCSGGGGCYGGAPVGEDVMGVLRWARGGGCYGGAPVGEDVMGGAPVGGRVLRSGSCTGVVTKISHVADMGVANLSIGPRLAYLRARTYLVSFMHLIIPINFIRPCTLM
ncbi:hypothetical protein HAZT_HAZT007453 [Hyalella azteca]|uniref:Uncharacterized protein n=1 Tax=Hyalella azteca TaxID=294128 RepID=A0A6A0H6I5_HYAAZ|nr:hypothetical protein HAZT_HAZT007453 [Hyalella azteca]